jgi:hypothetical protein
MRNGLLRLVAVIVFGAIIAFPTYGLATLLWQWFPVAPIPVAVAALALSVALALALPFTLRLFRYVSTAAIVAICGLGIYVASQHWHLDNVWWGFVGVIVAFAAFGWWKTATPLWRWANGIVAVQQTGETHHHGGDN